MKKLLALCALAALVCALPARGQIAGETGVPNIPTVLAAAGVTNLPAGSAIDVRNCRNLAFRLSVATHDFSTTNAVFFAWAPSTDGVTYDPGKTAALTITSTKSNQLVHVTTNIDTGAYLYVIPLFVSNTVGSGVLSNNWGVKYATKPGL